MGTVVPVSDPLTQSLVEKCTSWMVPHHVLGDELRRQGVSLVRKEPALTGQSSTIDLKLCIGTLEKDETVAQTKKERGAKILEKKDEIVANIIWRFLDVRG